MDLTVYRAWAPTANVGENINHNNYGCTTLQRFSVQKEMTTACLPQMFLNKTIICFVALYSIEPWPAFFISLFLLAFTTDIFISTCIILVHSALKSLHLFLKRNLHMSSQVICMFFT